MDCEPDVGRLVVSRGGFSFRPKSLVKIAGTERRPITGRQRNHNSRHYSVAIFPAPSAGVGPTLSVNVLSFQTSLETWTTAAIINWKKNRSEALRLSMVSVSLEPSGSRRRVVGERPALEGDHPRA